MDLNSVGCVVVVDDAGGALGIVTDRDVACRVVAAGRDPEKTTASDVMSSDLVTAGGDEPLPRVIERMKERGVRRIVVVEDNGRAQAVVSLDDILESLCSSFWNLNEALRIELRESRRTTWRRRMGEQRDEALEELRCQCAQVGRETRGLVKRELENLLESLRARR
jgi:signal-transduction protein with cAMP-binding, CBS, and nucleotidyltransferase domain